MVADMFEEKPKKSDDKTGRRVTVRLRPKVREALERHLVETEATATEVVNRALALLLEVRGRR